MAGDNYRIEKGQRLSSAVSARAWNRAQDAADIVLGSVSSIRGEPRQELSLPCVKAIFADAGIFGQVCIPSESSLPPNLTTPSVPFNTSSLETFSDAEKKMLNFKILRTTPSGVNSSQSAPLFVCLGNGSKTYAVSGLAIVRVRVFNYGHGCARLPVAFSGHTNAQRAEVSGCLDSAFWGPARICGYFINEGYIVSAGRITTQLSFPTYEFRWAVVSF